MKILPGLANVLCGPLLALVDPHLSYRIRPEAIEKPSANDVNSVCGMGETTKMFNHFKVGVPVSARISRKYRVLSHNHEISDVDFPKSP